MRGKKVWRKVERVINGLRELLGTCGLSDEKAQLMLDVMPRLSASGLVAQITD